MRKPQEKSTLLFYPRLKKKY